MNAIAKKICPAITSVVIPYKPPIDKIAALYLIAKLSPADRVNIGEVLFYKQNEGNGEMLQRWERAGTYAIDIGARKYHGNAESASEFVCKDLGLSVTDGIAELLRLINHNNKTGALKGQPFSIAHLLREFYEFSDDETWHREIISASAHVVEHFVEAFNSKPLRDPGSLIKEFPDLVRQLEPCNDQPFTIGRYLKDLWALGEKSDEITRRVGWWLDNRRKRNQLVEAGKVAFKMLDRRTFPAGKLEGIVFETDNRFLVLAGIKNSRYSLRLIKRSDGHVTISTAKLPMQETADYLMRREPGRWFYQPAMEAIINGGPQYTGVTPTDIPVNEMIEILQDFAVDSKERKKYGKARR